MFDVLMQEMNTKNFSPKTIELSVQYNTEFYNFIKKNPRDVVDADIRFYIFHLLGKQYSSSTIEIMQNALKRYLQCIHKRRNGVAEKAENVVKIREGPRRSDVRKMIGITTNPKHRIMMGLISATGMLVAEVVKIKVSDIDFNQQKLYLRNKEKYIMLSDSLIGQIRQYIRVRPYESKYLFASHEGHMTQIGVEKIVNMACYGARINPQMFALEQRREVGGIEA